MLSSSRAKIHEPLVTGVSPRHTDHRGARKTAKHEGNSWGVLVVGVVLLLAVLLIPEINPFALAVTGRLLAGILWASLRGFRAFRRLSRSGWSG